MSRNAANITKVATGDISTQAKKVKKQATEDIHLTSSKANIKKQAKQEVQSKSGEKVKLL